MSYWTLGLFLRAGFIGNFRFFAENSGFVGWWRDWRGVLVGVCGAGFVGVWGDFSCCVLEKKPREASLLVLRENRPFLCSWEISRWNPMASFGRFSDLIQPLGSFDSENLKDPQIS